MTNHDQVVPSEPPPPPAVEWTVELVDQLDGHWTHQLRPRLEGLTDTEYFWEPVPGCWSLRRRTHPPAPGTLGSPSADWAFDLLRPAPAPPPVTTIAWRLAHLIVSVLGERVAAQFGGPPVSHSTFTYAGTATGALAQLDDVYAAWITGVRQLDPTGLARPIGPSETKNGNSPDTPLASLILHINREVIHHGAEISLLRDLHTTRR